MIMSLIDDWFALDIETILIPKIWRSPVNWSDQAFQPVVVHTSPGRFISLVELYSHSGCLPSIKYEIRPSTKSILRVFAQFSKEWGIIDWSWAVCPEHSSHWSISDSRATWSGQVTCPSVRQHYKCVKCSSQHSESASICYNHLEAVGNGQWFFFSFDFLLFICVRPKKWIGGRVVDAVACDHKYISSTECNI